MNITNRTTHDVQQGTGPWLRLREGFDTASEAPAALGVSKYTTRAALMRKKKTRIDEEHSPATLGKFAAGHAAEASARPLAEVIAEGDLYPTTMSIGVEGLNLLASLDGQKLEGDLIWETKLWNEELAADVIAGTLPAHYTVQMDQELLVSGAQRCLFTCTDGTPERFVHCWYEADPEKFAALIAGWKQFHADLATYELPPATEAAPVGKAPDSLPALRIEVTGQVTASNLAEFRETALTAIRSVNRSLTTDADFADAEKAVRWCSDVETRLEAAKQHALSQTASIDALFKTIDDIAAEARRVRLDLNKLVTSRKTEVKEHAVAAARRAFDLHVSVINSEIAPMALRAVQVDFAGAIKGLRSISSMQDALDTTLAAAKITADTQGRAIRANVAVFKAAAGDDRELQALFADLSTLVHKPGDDFALLVGSRIKAHHEAEAAKEAKRQADEAARIAAAEQRAREQAQAALQAAAAPAPVQTQPAPVAAPVTAAQFAPQPQRQLLPVHNPAPKADEPATLNIGAIGKRLGFDLRADFITGVLHITPAAIERGLPRFRESQFQTICRQLVAHVGAMGELYAPETA